MRAKRALYLGLFFLACAAPGCPSRCKVNADCDSGETCESGHDADGPGEWCFPTNPTASDVRRAQAAGWGADSVTVGASLAGPNVSVTFKKSE